MSVQAELPVSERPGRRGEWRLLAEAALSDGAVKTGGPVSGHEARLIVKRIRRAASDIGALVKASYTKDNDGYTHWYVRVFYPEGTQR